MICPNPKCGRNVSPFDEKCEHCGEPLKGNPVRDYVKKADKVVSDAEARAEEIKGQIRNEFHDHRSFDKSGLRDQAAGSQLNPMESYADTSKPLSAKRQDKLRAMKVNFSVMLKNFPNKDVAEEEAIVEQFFQRIIDLKSMKIEEMYHFVFGNSAVIGYPDRKLLADQTDFIYRMETNECLCLGKQQYPTEWEPLTVNAYATYHPEVNRYEISLFDGYVNFLMGVELFFITRDKNILLTLRELCSEKLCSVVSILILISLYDNDEKYFFHIVENSFLPCYETIAHELGHICLGHCRDISINRNNDYLRESERQADSFANQLVQSFFPYEKDAKKPLFIGYIKNELVWTLMQKWDKTIATTHPLAEERLKNAIRANPKIAEELGMNETRVDEILKCFESQEIAKLILKKEVMQRGKMVKCARCDGTGAIDWGKKQCPVCGGSGEVEQK